MSAGVYEIRNTSNSHRYIGSSADVAERLRKHLGLLRKNKHHSKHLQRAWNKYGEGSFQMKQLFSCDPSMTIYYEQLCIDGMKPEYNVATCAESSARGAKRSDETRRKISEVQKGRVTPKEVIERRVRGRAGYEHSDDVKSRISASVGAWHKTEQGKRAVQKSNETRIRRVVCLNSGVVYNSIKDAERALGVDHSKISAVASGKRNHTGGYRFAYVGGEL